MRHFRAFIFLDGSATMTTMQKNILKVTMPFDVGTAAQLSLLIDIAAVPLECRGLLKGSIMHDGKSQLVV